MHYSVLLQESIDLLDIKPNGTYIDGTLGRAGHTCEILSRLSDIGRLIVFDKDPEAIKYAREKISDPRLTIVHDSFAQMDKHLEQLNIASVDGVLLDLGVSSPQLDTPERGFSFRYDAPLDMRMDNSSGFSAADWINSATEQELSNVFWRYGEEKFSRQIAKEIVKARTLRKIESTTELVDLITKIITYREKGHHPATRVFQAIRIFVNNELGDLELVLEHMPQRLSKDGRIVVISFHSLEDRIVKNKFTELSSGEKLPRWVMATPKPANYRVIAKKIKASDNEVNENTRSRSAIMRCLERINVESN